jgi:hypothetical protein
MQEVEEPHLAPFWQHPPPMEEAQENQPETQVVTVTTGRVVVVVLVLREIPFMSID